MDSEAIITVLVPLAVIAYIGLTAIVCIWQWRDS